MTKITALLTDAEIFKIDNGIVFYIRRKDVDGNLKQRLDEFVAGIWKDTNKLSKIMSRQESFQRKLLSLLCSTTNN
jgi:hypothetical protein